MVGCVRSSVEAAIRIAVVGAGGFIGQALTTRLTHDGHEVVPIARTPRGIAGERLIDDLETADWDALLQGVDVVVHLAARVHILKETASDPLAEFRRVNTAGTLAVAEAAVRQKVKRFIFISTIRVHGEGTEHGRPFRADDIPAPPDGYGISKLEGEEKLFKLSKETGLEVTVIRPPLVYGFGAPANFDAMIRWIRKGIPLPLGAVTKNRRSLVGIDNLADLISVCLSHPAAAGQIFLAADGRDVSTRELIELVASAMGRRARLLSVPVGTLFLVAKLTSKRALARRLLGNLHLDIEKTRGLLGWSPPVPLEEGLRRAVRGSASRPGETC